MLAKAVITLFAAWMMGLVTYVTVAVFSDVTLINGQVNAALGIVFGLPALVVGLIELRTRLWKAQQEKAP